MVMHRILIPTMMVQFHQGLLISFGSNSTMVSVFPWYGRDVGSIPTLSPTRLCNSKVEWLFHKQHGEGASPSRGTNLYAKHCNFIHRKRTR